MIDANDPAQVRACMTCRYRRMDESNVYCCYHPSLVNHGYSVLSGVWSEAQTVSSARRNNCGLAGRYWTPRRSVWQRVRAAINRMLKIIEKEEGK